MLSCCSRVSWTFLLLLGISAGFPLTNSDYRYPYSGAWSSAGPSPGLSDLEPEGFGSPFVSLRHEAPLHQLGSSSASGPQPILRAFGEAAGSSPSYEPSRFAMLYDSSADSPSFPTLRSPRPRYLGLPLSKKTPSVAVQHEPDSSSGSPAAEELPLPATTSSPSEAALPGNTATKFNFAVVSGFLESLPWDETPMGGGSPFHLTNMKPPRRDFPDMKAWDRGDVPLGSMEFPRFLPSSYFIQSRNGYQRAREVLSHSKYSEDIFDNLPNPFDTKLPIKAPPKEEQKV